MSLIIDVDTRAAEERITKMIETLAVLPVPAELTAWQSEDMKRRYPETEILNPTAALTLIYPRSRRQAAWLKQKRKARRQGIRTKPLLRGRAIHVKSNRPILRPALFQRLRERMAAMMARELKW